MPTLAITLKKQLKAARQQAIEVFQSNHKTEQCWRSCAAMSMKR
jgi:[protein-PII] uridylyltransferase